MAELDSKKFPYSDVDVKIVRKKDILETIAANITDMEVANELINHLETRAERTLKDKIWTGIPYLGSIRIPPGLSDECLGRQKDAKAWASQNLNKEEYVMFVKNCSYDNYQINRYRQYFTIQAQRNIKRYNKEFLELSRKKGKEWATLVMVFKYNLTSVKTEYEYYHENNNGEEIDT